MGLSGPLPHPMHLPSHRHPQMLPDTRAMVSSPGVILRDAMLFCVFERVCPALDRLTEHCNSRHSFLLGMVQGAGVNSQAGVGPCSSDSTSRALLSSRLTVIMMDCPFHNPASVVANLCVCV